MLIVYINIIFQHLSLNQFLKIKSNNLYQTIQPYFRCILDGSILCSFHHIYCDISRNGHAHLVEFTPVRAAILMFGLCEYQLVIPCEYFDIY